MSEAAFVDLLQQIDKLYASVATLKREHFVREVYPRLTKKKCKGAECYGCPVACPEKGFNIPPGTKKDRSKCLDDTICCEGDGNGRCVCKVAPLT